jgi:hypothetical protein
LNDLEIVGLLTPNRVEDEGDDMWKVFNVVQENMVRGGRSMQVETKNGHIDLRKLRALTSADRLLNANRELTATVKQLIAA